MDIRNYQTVDYNTKYSWSNYKGYGGITVNKLDNKGNVVSVKNTWNKLPLTDNKKK